MTPRTGKTQGGQLQSSKVLIVYEIRAGGNTADRPIVGHFGGRHVSGHEFTRLI